ncbi:Ras-GAP domain-containing protein [Entamoeba marina]
MDFKSYLNSLLEPPFTVIDHILTHATKQKDTKMATHIYKVLTLSNRLELYLLSCVETEIDNTLSEQTAFRLNSKTTRLLNIIYMSTGIGFLYHCLSPLFEEIMNKNIKLKNLRNCKHGDQDLTTCAKLVNLTFTSTVESKDYCPSLVRRVLRRVYDKLNEKFPDSNTSWICLGGFVFLRYLCPAIIQPLEWGLAYDIPQDMMETYTQISIVLQKMANVKHSELDSPLNRLMDVFVESRKVEYFNFVTELANVPYIQTTTSVEENTQQFTFYLKILQGYYQQHKTEIDIDVDEETLMKFKEFEYMNFDKEQSIVVFKSIERTQFTSYPKSIKSKEIVKEFLDKLKNGITISLFDMSYLQHSLDLEAHVYNQAINDLANARYNSYFPGIASSSTLPLYLDDYSQ